MKTVTFTAEPPFQTGSDYYSQARQGKAKKDLKTSCLLPRNYTGSGESARALVFFVTVDICYGHSMLNGSTGSVMICMGESTGSN